MKKSRPPPDHWLKRARALEAEDRLKEAEALIADSVPDPHFALIIAELYAERHNRLAALSDTEGAQQALKEAENWAYFFASQATSGGEGLAFSAERDDFLRRLREGSQGR